MKKLFLLFMILGLTSISFINVEGNQYDGKTIYTPISELNNYSLYDVFYGFNEYSDNWLPFGSNITDTGDNIIITNNTSNLNYYRAFLEKDYIANDKIYIAVSSKTNEVNASLLQLVHRQSTYGNTLGSKLISNPSLEWYHLSFISQYNQTIYDSNVYITVSSTNLNSSFTIKKDSFIYLNLTSHGLDNLTIDEIDYYYNLYLLFSYGVNPVEFYVNGSVDGYIEGYNDGVADGYDDGYDDGLYDYHTGNSYGQYDYTLSEPYDQATQANISLLSVFSLVIGVVMSMLGFIINIEMFGISIASILGTLAIGVSIIWLLKLIRG
jgi:hypothetical protein